jgi:hypothetical protein
LAPIQPRWGSTSAAAPPLWDHATSPLSVPTPDAPDGLSGSEELTR